MDNSLLPPSSSVSDVLKKTGPEKPITASSLAQNTFNYHDDIYLGGKERSFRFDTTTTIRKVQEWFDDVQTLYDLELIKKLSKSKERPMLHGRMLIIGLGLIEASIYQQLKQSGAFDKLVQESESEYKIQKLLPDVLTEHGRVLYEKLINIETRPDLLDSVKNWSDDALKKSEDDLLGRVAFARFLAKRITSILPTEGAYAIHLYGPWGAGKSTVLNFLKDILEPNSKKVSMWEKVMQIIIRLSNWGKKKKEDEWLVFEFNAWRHQHIEPPWWSLMEGVFQYTKKKLTLWGLVQEYSWRLNLGGLIYLIPAIIMLWLFSLAISWIPTNIIPPKVDQPLTTSEFLSAVASAAKNISEIIALILTVWGGILAINRSLLFGTAKSAQDYKDRIQDPMNEIKKHFNRLIKNLLKNNYRVVIFIDDLDRCRSSYVVELLEGIQTLFREAPVFFIVASDRRWLNACYEQVYEKFKSQVNELGKPLGTLFLEKAFRFSTPMPGISDELEKRYWLYLLDIKNDEQIVDFAVALKKADEIVSQIESEEEVRAVVKTSTKKEFAEQRAIREKAVERLATPAIMARLEHTLRLYKELLEENPRAMKRLVNTYSANLTLDILSETNIERHQLVLWTILSTRWPSLAEYLEEDPEMIEKIIQKNVVNVRDELKPLFLEPEILKVVNGEGKEVPQSGPLNKETIEKCVQMHA